MVGIAAGDFAPGVAGTEIATISEPNGVFELFTIGDPVDGGASPVNRTEAFFIGGSGTAPGAAELIGIKGQPDGNLRALVTPTSTDPDQRYRLPLIEAVDDLGDFTVPSTIILEDNPAGRSTFIDFVIIPEPASLGLIALGATLILRKKRR